MVYLALVPFLIAYFETLGQSILHFFKKEAYSFSFGIGIITWLAIAYVTTGILTDLNCSFYLILGIYTIIFFITIFFIFKYARKLHFSLWKWLFLSLVAILMLYYSANSTLGDLNGFDSTHYLNMVTGNISLDTLNSKSVYDGTISFTISNQYRFQSFYYLISCILFVFEKICSLFSITFYSAIGYIWIFQLIYNFLFLSIIFLACDHFFPKKYHYHILIIAFFVLCYFRAYFNSTFGFYGNTYRTIIIAYASLFLIERYQKENIASKYLSILALLASCAASSTAVFMVFFIIFARFFVEIDKNDLLFKEFAILIIFPLINLITILRNDIVLAIIAAIVISLIMYFSNDLLVKYIRKFKLKLPILIIFALSMFALSYSKTGIFFNLEGFINNGSEQYDMTLNYFKDYVSYSALHNYKFVALFFLTINLFFSWRKPMIKMFWILIIVIFNPFCFGLLASLNNVWYRAFEIIINPCTIVMMMSYAFKLFHFELLKLIYIIVIAMAILTGEKPSSVLLWHNSFELTDNYNILYKMSNSELDIIFKIHENVEYLDIQDPYIISTNIMTQSMIPEGKYIFGRVQHFNESWTESEKELYKIFYPILYWGDPAQPDNPDYDHMCEYITDAGIDFIVQDKSVEYFDEEQNIWYSLTYKIDECGKYAIYENDEYALYMFGE